MGSREFPGASSNRDSISFHLSHQPSMLGMCHVYVVKVSSPLINIRYIWWHHGRCAHFTGLVHKTWKLCPLMGQVIHLVLFESVHSITRYGSKSKCPKSAPSSKIIFNGAALFCEIATQVCNIAKKSENDFSRIQRLRLCHVCKELELENW